MRGGRPVRVAAYEEPSIDECVEGGIDIGPEQFEPGRCRDCKRPLSVYNPYVVCGPCRVRLYETITSREVAAATRAEGRDGLMAWERFPRRKAVRRGPLLR